MKIAGAGATDALGTHVVEVLDLVRRYLAAIGGHRSVLQVPLPGAWGRGMRDGTLLPARVTRLGARTFDGWLATVAAPEA